MLYTTVRSPAGAFEGGGTRCLAEGVADPTRLQLMSLVAVAGDGEASVCDLTAPLGLTQPTISHHLKVLVDAGLLTREQRGQWAYYSLVRSRFNDIRTLLDLG